MKKNIIVILTILLFINLPIINALEISNVNVEQIRSGSAVVVWETDQPADSFVEYGLETENLRRVGDARPKTEHQLQLQNLESSSTYYFSVESNDISEANDGSFYTFSTPAPDLTPPVIVLELAERVAGTQVNIVGYTEPLSTVELFIGGVLVRETIAEILTEDPESFDLVTSEDSADSTEQVEADDADPTSEDSADSTEEVEADDADPTSEDSADETADDDSALAGQAVSQEVAEEETPEGRFNFPNVALTQNQVNNIRIVATDPSGNSAEITKQVYADTEEPTISLLEEPEFLPERDIRIQGSVSEPSIIRIFVGETLAYESEGAVTNFNQTVSLQEGENLVRVVAEDLAGLQESKEYTVFVDTEPPTVDFTLRKGNEYYEGRAETDITGTTEPGADVYLYIYRPRVDDYRADFKHADKRVKADDEGHFEFKEVKFPPAPYSSLEELQPREVPSNLQNVLIPHLEDEGDLQTKTYHVYVIAEDRAGKTGYGEDIVHVHTCYSGNLAFDIGINPMFPPQPFRLNPQLMEDGRENIAAVFDISYAGAAVESIELNTGNVLEPYEIYGNPSFEPACTQEMLQGGEFQLGCQLLGHLSVHANDAGTAVYLTGNLKRATDFVESDYSWEDFKERNLKFPLKILLQYKERESDGSWSAVKTQATCHDLGYLVDVPVDSSDLVPDFLANEGVDALNWTIHAIEKVKPILDTAMIVTGISCFFSYITKFITIFYRNFMASFEPKTSGCPARNQQQSMYLDSTRLKWAELRGHPDLSNNLNPQNRLPDEDNMDILDEKCPKTAGAWEAEAKVDQLLRFTCDRFFCRQVPARWTGKAEKRDIQNVFLSQSQCAATSGGDFLRPLENCQEWYTRSLTNANDLHGIDETYRCYMDKDGGVYAVHSDDQTMLEQNIWVLRPINSLGQIGDYTAPMLLAYQPPGSDTFITAVDQSCSTVCRRTPGYAAADDGYGDVNNAGPCYLQEGEGAQARLLNRAGNQMRGGDFGGVYTQDCFVKGDQLYQCVCQFEGDTPPRIAGSREALKEVDGQAEPWIYRQAKVYGESGRSQGTNYDEDRYYKGRDFTAAFGLNSGFDNFRTDINTMKNTKVNPNQYFGAWQTLCLPKINAQLTMLQSILLTLKNCIVEAKHSSFQDAGMCKTLFTQQVCGLMYKAISSLANQCSPIRGQDIGQEGELNRLRAGWQSFREAMPQTIASSTQDLTSLYGAQAHQYFATGIEGFAESVCLAMFGFGMPSFNFDFITEAAYAVPMITRIYFPIANRELTTFNPVQGTATYNYELGGVLLPGCNIRGYRVSLKCVGPEDRGKPGVNCAGQDCDCINIEASAAQPYAEERTHLIDSQFGGISRLEVFDFPIDSPQQVSSLYRYDHVVVELTLGQNEDPQQCFDAGYRTGNGGLFYFPINQIKASEVLQCQVELNTGRYTCPALGSLFGGGQNYLEPPFVRCYDKRQDSYVACNTPNAIVAGDQLIVKPSLKIGEESACLIVEESSNQFRKKVVDLRDYPPGPLTPPIDLGLVDDRMLSGGAVATLHPVGSDARCDIEVTEHPSREDVTGSTLNFYYRSPQQDRYALQIPDSVIVINTDDGYDKTNNNYLIKDGSDQLTIDDINSAELRYEGFAFNLVLRGLSSGSGVCTYRADRGSNSQSPNSKTLDANFKLLIPPEDGSCFLATEEVPESSLGKNVHLERILIQSSFVEVYLANEIHEDFLARDYRTVVARAQDVINLNNVDIEEAIAAYYYTAALVMMGAQPNHVRSLLNFFFDRTNGLEQLPPYPPNVYETSEYEKIFVYMCEIDSRYGGNHNHICSPQPQEDKVPSQSLCGADEGLDSNFNKPDSWETFTCKNAADECHSSNEYLPPDVRNQWTTYGCPPNQQCCP